MNFDVVIVGGGVIGLSIARELKKRGIARIAVVDRGPIGREASWAAAGMLAPNIECEEVDEFHRLCTASLELFPKFAAALLEETGVDVELDRTGTLYLAFEEIESSRALEKYRTQRAAGIKVESLSLDDVPKLESSISSKVQSGLFYPNDWQVENRKLVDGLETFCRQEGIVPIENSAVEKIETKGGRAVGIRTAREALVADHVVLAAGAWASLIDIEGLGPSFAVKPIRGQMIAYAGQAGRIRHVIYSDRGYVVPRADGRILVGATVEDAGFDKHLTEGGIKSLRDAAAEISPLILDTEPAEKWAGLRPYAADGLPVLGPIPGIDGLTIATGHFRNGILLSPITAQLIADLIADGERSKYFDLFGTERFLRASKVSGPTNI